MSEAHLRRVQLEFVGYLVNLHFESEARLRRAVPALGAARRLVGEGAQALEAIVRHVVSDGLERAGIEGRGDAVGAVCAAVEISLEVHRGDCAVGTHARFDFHQDGMSPAMAVENFLARECNFDGTARPSRQFADDNLVVEWVALAAEAAAVRRGDDADVRGPHSQSLRKGAMDVVRRLRRSPERELVVRVVMRD